MWTKADRSGTRADAMPSIIAAGMRVVGEVAGPGDVQIDGAVEGDVRASSLTIGPSGSVTGEVVAERVMVSGEVTGCIRARSVSLTKTARVRGDIVHENLAIEAGAAFEGQVSRLQEKTKDISATAIMPTPQLDQAAVELPAVAAKSA